VAQAANRWHSLQALPGIRPCVGTQPQLHQEVLGPHCRSFERATACDAEPHLAGQEGVVIDGSVVRDQSVAEAQHVDARKVDRPACRCVSRRFEGAEVGTLFGRETWAYFGLVGGGMYLYFAGRGLVTREAMRARGYRIGADRSVKSAYMMLVVWGVVAVVTIAAAAADLWNR
jgi:hypothetical protein